MYHEVLGLAQKFKLLDWAYLGSKDKTLGEAMRKGFGHWPVLLAPIGSF